MEHIIGRLILFFGLSLDRTGTNPIESRTRALLTLRLKKKKDDLVRVTFFFQLRMIGNGRKASLDLKFLFFSERRRKGASLALTTGFASIT